MEKHNVKSDLFALIYALTMLKLWLHHNSDRTSYPIDFFQMTWLEKAFSTCARVVFFNIRMKKKTKKKNWNEICNRRGTHKHNLFIYLWQQHSEREKNWKMNMLKKNSTNNQTAIVHLISTKLTHKCIHTTVLHTHTETTRFVTKNFYRMASLCVV